MSNPNVSVSFDGQTPNVNFAVDHGQKSVTMGANRSTPDISVSVNEGSIKHGVYIKTTEEWNALQTYVPLKGDICVYTDHGQIDGTDIPGIKIGNGTSYLSALPFVGDDITGIVGTVTVNGETIEPVNKDIDIGNVLRSFTETDPTVPSWAKAANKPSYTAQEVGAAPDTTVSCTEENVKTALGTAQSGTRFLREDGTWQTPSGGGDVSTVSMNGNTIQPVNGDVNLGTVVTAETDPTVPSWAKASTKPSYTAQEVGAAPDTTVSCTTANVKTALGTSQSGTRFFKEDGTWDTPAGGSGDVSTVTMNGSTIQPIDGDIDLGDVATSSNGTAGTSPAARFVTSMTVTDGVIEYSTQSVRSATDEQSGIVSTSTQTFAGNKTFTGITKVTNDTDASSTAGGALRVSGGLGVAKNIYGLKVYNAVWNDYAEFRKAETIEPGRCVTETDSGVMALTEGRLQAGCRLTSDTYGSCMGETDEAKTPIAVAGRVLVYPFKDRSAYHLGDAVCSAPGGTVDIMTRDEIREYPERIVGTVSEIPKYGEWQAGTKENPVAIPVDGRIWVYVR